jgi:hypothetical protein
VSLASGITHLLSIEYRRGGQVVEYRVVNIALNEAQAFLNQAAGEGWELVSANLLYPAIPSGRCVLFLRKEP